MEKVVVAYVLIGHTLIQVRTRKRSGMEIPDRLWAKLLKNRFKDSDCRSKV